MSSLSSPSHPDLHPVRPFVSPRPAGVLLFSGVGQQPASPAVCLLFGALQPLLVSALLQNQHPAGHRRGAHPPDLYFCGGGQSHSWRRTAKGWRAAIRPVNKFFYYTEYLLIRFKSFSNEPLMELSRMDCKLFLMNIEVETFPAKPPHCFSSLFYSTRAKRRWFLFSLSQTVPSHPRQGQGHLKSRRPSAGGSSPPLMQPTPTGRTGSSWRRSCT